MNRYLHLFSKLLFFSLKSMLEYRVNIIFKLLYGPSYIGVLFVVLLVAFHNTQSLAGWSKNEALLLFAVFNLIYAHCLILFIDAIRHLLWTGIRAGEVDQWLVKPGSAQFYLTFSRPNTDLLGLWLIVSGFFIYQVIKLETLTLPNTLGFIYVMFLGHIIAYLALSTYATLGFLFIRAQQIIEVFDKATDFAQYPLPIFPPSIQMLFVTLLPIAYFSYVPTLFLLDRGDWNTIWQSTLTAITLFIINQFAWKYALRHYSSASS